MSNNFFSQESTFSRFMNLLWSLIYISILWFVFSLPVITMGAATTAAYYAMAKVVRFKTGTIFQEFFRSFRANFKQATIFSLVYAIVFGFLIFDCTYFYNNEASYSLGFLYLFYGLILLLFASFMYLMPCLSRFADPMLQLVRMAVVMMFRNFLSTILLLALLAALLLGIYLMPWGVLVFPGAMLLAKTFVMEPILRKVTPKPEEESEEADKWYYQ